MTIYRPKEMNALDTQVTLLSPTMSDYCGNIKLTYPEIGDTLFVNWTSYGGTETVTDNQLTVLDTAQITTWYDPRIKKACRLRLESGEIYEIIGKPNDIDNRHIFMRFKVQRVEASAPSLENKRGGLNV